jgi:DegV family protein with EDD domain
MDEYVIVSDATLDLSVNVIKEYDIRVIPMGVSIDDIQFLHHPDEREISVEDFYGKLKNGAVSHTTQITPAVFIDFFSEILDKGQDILYIAFSSGLSGTYNTSQIVIRDLIDEYPDRKIYVIDSLCASVGEGLLVYNAAVRKKDGMNMDDLREWVEQNKRKVCHWFTVKDLFYLKRGGRLSSIEAIIGTALKIRPVLSTDDEGKLIVNSKIRGSRAELDLMMTKLTEEGCDIASQTVIIGHADNLTQAKELEKLIRDRNLVKDILIERVGPIIGTHTGPGMLALTFIGEQSR